ncbi:hypothetical protein P0082_00035 [Candidatus Haliotispira prima]|uniref:Uncharacterized protein n=1 Tax=Candidatus Haliotispira prima TaxID=3034016 RepID=A0ABY8MH47_9SPIO|nr:hypothetical protein P0082_12475 [Candidatus Haliotispira prima]WGK69280.1 hypothetical protein P0082_00035 [Candidatus Haliotispira prima]
MVSSVQLEMSSTLAIAKIGAVIRLATETAPTKAEAETNAGYVSLAITAGGTRKFSISQHYGSDFTDGLTLADVLAANTDYKLYLFFEANNTVNPIEGVTLTNNVASLPFTTATLSPAGDAVWARSLAGEQFVGSLPEWSYSESQKGVFVAYAQLVNGFNTTTLTIRNADNTFKGTIGVVTSGSVVKPNPLFLFGFAKLGNSYPDADNYYYVMGADDTNTISGKICDLVTADFSQTIKHQVPLNRY